MRSGTSTHLRSFLTKLERTQAVQGSMMKKESNSLLPLFFNKKPALISSGIAENSFSIIMKYGIGRPISI